MMKDPGAVLRILTLCYEYPPVGGGGAGVAKGLATTLTRRGHAVDVVTMGFGDLPQNELIDGVRVYRIRCGRRRANKCTAREAARYVMKAKPIIRDLLDETPYDIVHVHFIYPDGVLAWLATSRTPIPYVITAHGTDVPGYNQKGFFKLIHPLLIGLWRRVTSGAKEIVAPSDALAELINDARADTRITVIPNAIDTAKFSPLPKTRRILIATRFVKRKGVQHVLRAMSQLETDVPLVIAGGGEYEGELLALNEELGSPAQFVGWMDNESPEFLQLLRESAIYVLPSDFENFPMSVLEAMSVGAAIVTTRGHGCEEAVGDTAELVTPGNIDPDQCIREIKAALTRLLNDDEYRQTLGDRARQRVVENFAWSAIAAEYEAVYRSHAQERQPVAAEREPG